MIRQRLAFQEETNKGKDRRESRIQTSGTSSESPCA